ncbi:MULTISPECIES: DotU family type IV/VI secretion system protein [unclassified Corallococcus]|uniref:DotU family type IV/VI secretion system protein n=1 Tax=unclassified Corallococcus TaxID=2685029 RepID=UPI001A8F9EE7|nr:MULTISPECIES: DotU family type IV/VI secretion system protein [unclassified Corallococcus]MBN9686063.1 DotU family type IV/VI secretion system protein [Corallococcus sp. NCSPR001]WAS82501.1 DotU family type IV/VI secretion system protein [Corallococcus sp. NCRR]
MKLEHWQVVFTQYRQAQSVLDGWLPQSAPGSAAAAGLLGREGLRRLHDELLEVIERLRAGLGAHARDEEVQDALKPFTYLVDERVLLRLADAEQPLWPLLQYRLFGEDGGGEAFYTLADQRLDQPGSPALLFEMLHFCITAGFGGRYLGHTAKLREYQERLSARIVTPPPPPAPVAAGESLGPLLYTFPARYYAASAASVLGLQCLLWWVTR